MVGKNAVDTDKAMSGTGLVKHDGAIKPQGFFFFYLRGGSLLADRLLLVACRLLPIFFSSLWGYTAGLQPGMKAGISMGGGILDIVQIKTPAHSVNANLHQSPWPLQTMCATQQVRFSWVQCLVL